MNESQLKQALALAWDLAQKQNVLLGVVVGISQEMAKMLEFPHSAQQVNAWIAMSDIVNHSTQELNASLESIRRIVDPLFPTDS